MRSAKTSKDQGWAWMVLAASFGTSFISGVFMYTVGILHAELLHRFRDDVTTTAWVGSVCISLVALLGPVSSWTINNFGCRVCSIVGGVLCSLGCCFSALASSVPHLIVTYGIMAGTGLGLAYSPAIIVVCFYFRKYRGLATSITVTGSACGLLSGAILVQHLLDEYGLKGTFLLLGGLSLHTIVFGALYRPTDYERTFTNPPAFQKETLFTVLPEDEKLLPQGPDFKSELCIKSRKPVSSDKTHLWRRVVLVRLLANLYRSLKSVLVILRNKAFICHCVGVYFSYLASSGVFLHLPEYMHNRGTDSTSAALLFVVLGVFSIASRLICGLTITDVGMNKLVINLGMNGLCGVWTCALPLMVQSYAGQMSFAAMFGLYTGGLNVFLSVLTVDLVGLNALTNAFGIVVFASGLGCISGPPLAGLVVDNGWTYEHSFFLLGISFFLASTCDIVVAFFHLPPSAAPEEDVGCSDPVQNVPPDVLKEASILGSTLVLFPAEEICGPATVIHSLESVQCRTDFGKDIMTDCLTRDVQTDCYPKNPESDENVSDRTKS